MTKMTKMARGKTYYVVVGGQYNSIVYGWCPTLLGAKRKATQCKELWDNWQGRHTPAVREVSLDDLKGVYKGRDGQYYLASQESLDEWLWLVEQAGLELPEEVDEWI